MRLLVSTLVLACALCQAADSEKIVAALYVRGLQLMSQPTIDVKGLTEEGTVSLEVQVDQDGRVDRVLYANGTPQLREAATRSVGAWRFARGQNLPASAWAYVYFTKDRGANGRLKPPAVPPPPFGAKLREIDLDGVPSELRERVRGAIGVRPGDLLSENELNHSAAALKKIHPKLRLMLRSGSGGGPTVAVYLEHAVETGTSRGR